jgi:hypothetical protein
MESGEWKMMSVGFDSGKLEVKSLIGIVEIQNLEKIKSELQEDLKQSLNSPENHLSIEELDALLEDTLKSFGGVK